MKLFNFNKQTADPDKQDLENRLQVFLDKLMLRAEELYKEVRATAQSIADEDPDSFKRDFHQFKAGIIAQFMGIMQKGSSTFQTQVLPAASAFQQMNLSQIFNNWHSRILEMLNTAFEGVQERNLERDYAAAMDEYNQHKDQLHCTQCGGKLVVDKFYHTATYLTCPFCQTQNTFDPGSKAKMIELMAWPLADLRSSALKKAHKAIRQEKGPDEALESYEQYAKAVVREMNQILPGLEAAHQELYERLVHDFKAYGVSW